MYRASEPREQTQAAFPRAARRRVRACGEARLLPTVAAATRTPSHSIHITNTTTAQRRSAIISRSMSVQPPEVIDSQTIETGSRWLHYKRDTLRDSHGR